MKYLVRLQANVVVADSIAIEHTSPAAAATSAKALFLLRMSDIGNVGSAEVQVISTETMEETPELFNEGNDDGNPPV